MTSLAFFFGVLPLALNKGAGSGAQNAMGTAVNGGMATATVLAIFLVPVFFVVVRRFFPAKEPAAAGNPLIPPLAKGEEGGVR
jgi:Cu/Ag efflux pump CusA